MESLDRMSAGGLGAPPIVERGSAFDRIRRTELEVALLFDATGSMGPYIDQVRRDLTRLAEDLWKSVPGCRLALVAYQDYCRKSAFVTLVHPFATDITTIRSFIDRIEPKAGQDTAEAVEEALYQANQLPWSIGARRAVILVGDAPPHGVIDSRSACVTGRDFREEARALATKGVPVFTVQCGRDAATAGAFREIAALTFGKHLELTSIGDLCELLVAISVERTGRLSKYINELDAAGRLTPSKRLLLEQLRPTEREGG